MATTNPGAREARAIFHAVTWHNAFARPILSTSWKISIRIPKKVVKIDSMSINWFADQMTLGNARTTGTGSQIEEV